MLAYTFVPRVPESDQRFYESVIPTEHVLRKALKVVPWNSFFDQMAPFYSQTLGRPPEYPVLMLKLSFLSYFCNLTDRGVIARSQTDFAFRHFLQIPVYWKLPDPSSLCYFRARMGEEGFRKVFEGVVQAAREHGVVRDRLRIKDATHIIGNMAVPTALALVAQTRDKLLEAAEPFAPMLVKGERVKRDVLREDDQNLAADKRLVTRVVHLREILTWADEIASPEETHDGQAWGRFLAQRDLAHKILEDQEHPGSGDRTLSTTDTDARCGKHGQWFDGYILDVMIDADSEIITQINVLPGNGDEAADAVELIRQEERAYGNDVEALSIDGVGFNGPVLRELEDPDGLNVNTYVPVPKESESSRFTPADFGENADRTTVTCPAGQTTSCRYHDKTKQTTKYRFPLEACRNCPLRNQCMKNAPQKHGRTVCKTDYQAEHERARQKTTTPQYAEVRRQHPKVERKLGEVMNRHQGRHARYRGRWKVLIQELLCCTAANVKRLTKLVSAPNATIPCAT